MNLPKKLKKGTQQGPNKSKRSLREAPLKKTQGLFGHCPNSDCPPPPLHSNGHSGALYFWTDLSKCHLNFNFHCISAPNHPGKGSDPPNQANAPLNMDNSSQNKCPKPFGQGSRPPPPFGQCPNRPDIFQTGASLSVTRRYRSDICD